MLRFPILLLFSDSTNAVTILRAVRAATETSLLSGGDCFEGKEASRSRNAVFADNYRKVEFHK